MLQITIPEAELFNEKTSEIIYVKETVLSLEHSLISLSKWEMKWQIPFLDKNTPKTPEQSLDYVRCMTLTKGVDPNVYLGITPEVMNKINAYIDNPMTATWFDDIDEKPHASREIITNEIIYYWMISLQVPMEFQKWHLNRLMTLIRVCNDKNAPAKKMSKADLYKRHEEINKRNRKRFNSAG